MDSISPDVTTTRDDGRLARGRTRMREIASAAVAERNAIAARILSQIGRVPTELDRIAAINIAAMHVRAERLEAQGKDASQTRQQITQAMRASFRPARPGEVGQPQESDAEYLERTKREAEASAGGPP